MLVLVVQICRLTKVKVFKLQDRFIHKHVKKPHFIRDCFFLLSWFWNCKSESLIVNFSFYPLTAFSTCALKVQKNLVYHIFDGCISFNQNNESLLPGQVNQTTKWHLWNQANIKKLAKGSWNLPFRQIVVCLKIRRRVLLAAKIKLGQERQ